MKAFWLTEFLSLRGKIAHYNDQNNTASILWKTEQFFRLKLIMNFLSEIKLYKGQFNQS